MTYPTIDPAELRRVVNNQLAAALVERLGYEWPADRTERVASSAADLIARGVIPATAFAEALDDEFILNGLE